MHRKLLDNPIATNPLLIWLFCYLLLIVSYKDHIFFLWKIRIEQKKGQAIISKKDIAKSFGISRWTLDSYLGVLQIEHMISIKTTSKYTVITIVNWDKYQTNDIKIASNWTTTWTSTWHQPDTINKDKNIKEYNIDSEATQSIKYILTDWELVEMRGLDILQEFVDYWWEKNRAGKEKRQLQRTWDTNLRLKKWKNNKETNFGTKQLLDYEIVDNYHKAHIEGKLGDVKQYFKNKYPTDRQNKYRQAKERYRNSDLFSKSIK